MDIVILDLEWNTAYNAKEKRFLNEIIEFGAVKLDENINLTDRFQLFVRSKLSKKLRGRVKELTHITNDDLSEKGEQFPDVLDKFSRWAGENTLLLTWSNTDLHVLLDNCRCFTKYETIPFLYYYADLQKYIQDYLGVGDSSQLGLAAAAEQLQIYSGDIDLHRAEGDSLLCAKLLRRCYNKDRLDDYVSNTRGTDFYERLVFRPYIITEVNNCNIEPGDLRFKCPKCENYLRRTARWNFKNRFLCADFVCKTCSLKFKGRVQAKKLYDGVAIKKTLTEHSK